MTRPMPGPPQWIEPSGLRDWDWNADGRWRNRWNLHWEYGRDEYNVAERHDKRLTDAECSAEYWRAVANLLAAPPHSSEMLSAREKKRVCANFATHPHALEES